MLLLAWCVVAEHARIRFWNAFTVNIDDMRSVAYQSAFDIDSILHLHQFALTTGRQY
jgi:hypothetical protein